ncbi:MAG: VCBS repeat-containing protein, partial [Acidobacteria bacterium]|nr:VCBS repeat-containing protein [Acidobacteriota bacterium]
MFKTVSPVRWLVVCVALAAWALVPSTSAFKTTTPDFTTTTLTGFGFAWDVVIDDVNGDGHADLIGALVMPSENSVGVALGDGAGGFSAMQRYFSGPRPSSVAIADMNGDGFKDAVLANQNGDNPGGNVAVLFGDGTGAFGPPTVTVNAQFAKALKIGDFNGDGAPDVAVIDFNAWVQLFINNNDSTGQMTARPAQAVPGGQPVRLAVGDIDGDGDQDMAVVSAFADPNTGGTDALALYLGDGTGELSAPVMRSFPSGFNVRDVAVRNIDADLELEIVASSGGGVGGDGGAGLWVFDNGVGGVAASPVRYAAPVGAHGLAMGDVNDDGHVDVLLALKDTANLVYYLGNGDGTFAPLAGGTYPGISGQPQYVAVGEFDAAGQSSLDVVIARVAQDPIYLHNRPNLPPVANAGADQTVTASVATGAFVTLDGSASTDPESTALTFEWRDAANTVVGNAAVSGVTVPLGVHVYTLRVTDAGGAVATDTVTITTLAGTTTSIACSTPVTYTGAAITPCTATVLGVDGFSLGGAPSYTDNMAVGTATASYTFAGDAAHASSFGSTTFSISAKPVTATLTAIDKVYDGTATEPDANMSCTVTGTVPGDVVTCAASNGVFSGANAGSSAVSATVTLGGAHAGNYTLGAVGTSLQSTTLTATSGGSVASTTADLVYGQLGSFTVRLQNNGGISANSMNQPYRVAIDSTGGLYVAEEQNHRVVYFSAGATTATRVYGQSGSFTSATSNNGGLSANSLSYARGVAVDANDNLYIVDGGNHRVLFYPAGTTTATRVYGQGGVFTTGTINKGGVSADSLNDPTIAVADASGNVYIADQNNNRVLFYAGTSTTATRVYGQNGNFATTGTGVSATTFNQPGNLVVDAAGNLYVSDLTNNRVLFFLNGSATATRVYGQNGNFGTNSAGTSATALRFPRAAAIDSNNNLYVADQQNHRVLFFPAGTTTATRVYGQGGSFTSGTSNNGGVSANSLNNPLGGAISADGKLYIADLSNNRVLRFSTIGSGRITTA